MGWSRVKDPVKRMGVSEKWTHPPTSAGIPWWAQPLCLSGNGAEILWGLDLFCPQITYHFHQRVENRRSVLRPPGGHGAARIFKCGTGSQESPYSPPLALWSESHICVPLPGSKPLPFPVNWKAKWSEFWHFPPAAHVFPFLVPSPCQKKTVRPVSSLVFTFLIPTAI